MSVLKSAVNSIKRALSIENPSTPISQWVESMYGTSSGQTVSVKSAMGLSVVYACIKVLSEDIASLPLHVYERVGDRTVLAENHKINRLIGVEPSPLYTPYVFHETLIAQAASSGNGYALMHTSRSGQIEELELLDSNKITPKVVKVDDRKRVFYYMQGKKEPYSDEEILHLPALSMNGIVGQSPITQLRETVGEAMAMVEHGNNFYTHGAKLSGAIEYPGVLGEEGIKNIRDGWNRTHTGKNAQGTAILEGGATFKPISLSPEDLLFIEGRKFSVEEIARAYRIPLHMLNSLDRATFSNIEQQSIDYVKNCLHPWTIRVENEYNRKLFTNAEQGRYFVKYDLESRLQGDSKAQAEYYSKLFQVGALSQNDIRQRLGMNPIENGDKYYVQTNLDSDENREENNDE